MYSVPDLELVCCSMSSSNLLLDHIQISQEADQVVWCSHLFKNFPQFVVIHTSKGIHPKRGNMGWGQRAWMQLGVLPLIFSFSPKPEGTHQLWTLPQRSPICLSSHSLGSAFLCVGHITTAESLQLSWQSFYTHWTQAVTKDETGVSTSPPPGQRWAWAPSLPQTDAQDGQITLCPMSAPGHCEFPYSSSGPFFSSQAEQ